MSRTIRLEVSSASVLSSIRTRAYFTLLCTGPIPVELFDLINLKELRLSHNKLTGKRSAPCTERFERRDCIRRFVCAGPLPKVLPTSLEILNLAGYGRTPHKFTGGIPSEWGALTNLKELNMDNCSLDGKLLSTRSTTSCPLLTRRVVAQFRTKSRRP